MTNTRKRVNSIKNGLQNGDKLCHLHTDQGNRWFLVGKRKEWIATDIAELVIAEPDVFPCEDGMFGSTQCYRMGQ